MFARRLAVVVLFFSGCRGAPAPQSADTPAATVYTASSDGVEIVLYELTLRFDVEGRQTLISRLRTRVTAPNGIDQSSSVGAAWSPWYERKPEIRGWVTGHSGDRVELDLNTLDEDAVYDDPRVYSDRRMLRAPLPNVVVGAIGETEIIRRQAQPYFKAGAIENFHLSATVPIAELRVTVEAPEGLPLKWEVRGSTIAASGTVENGVRRVRLEAFQIPAVGGGEAHQSRDRVWPQLVVSTSKSWSAIAGAYEDLTAPKIQPAAVAELARSWVGGEKNSIASRVNFWLEFTTVFAMSAFSSATVL